LTFSPHGRLAVWYFWYFAFIGAFLPYFALYLQSIGLSAGRIAVLMSLGQLMRLLAPLLWSWLADSGGRRVRIVVASTAAALASFSVVFLTQDFAALLAGMAILHFFWSASLPLVEALTLGHLAANPERYGRIRLWGSIGFIVTVMGVGLLLDSAPIKSQLWVSWALLLGTLLSALTLTEVKGHGGQIAGPIFDVLRQRKVVFLLVAGLFMTAAHGALYVFYSIHLVAHGYGKGLVGLLWTLGVVAEIVVFLLMPRISLRISLRTILLACFVLAALRFLVIGWGVAFIGLLVVAQLLHGATFGAHHAATMAALNRWFEPGQQARAQALYGSVAYGAGGLGGALLAGALWEGAGAGITFSAASVLALLGLVLVWRGVPGDAAGAPVR
jgi:PPP family 3-phenylpropionic acid transporter